MTTKHVAATTCTQVRPMNCHCHLECMGMENTGLLLGHIPFAKFVVNKDDFIGFNSIHLVIVLDILIVAMD